MIIRKILSSLFFVAFFLSLFISSAQAGIWIKQYTIAGANAQGLFFNDAKTGYIANGTLYKTTNRGISWESISLGSASSATYLPYSSYYINSTLYTAGSGILPTQGLIRSTTDGGTTWTEKSPGDLWYYGIWFADQNNAVATGASLAGSDFRHTIDGGTTWTAIDLSMGGETRKAHSTSTSNFWVCGTTSVAKWNGAAWSAIAVTGASTLRGIHAEDASNIWASGDDGANGCVFKTTNGGTSWTKIALPTTATINDIWFVDSNKGWAVGNGGIIYYTANGGGSASDWTEQTSSTTSNLLAVYFTDSNNGWLAGTDGFYKYIVSPEVSSISPSSGAVGSTLDLTFTGTDFQGSTGTDKPTIAIAGVTINSVTYESSTQISANITIPASLATGSKTVTITNPDSGAKLSTFTVSTATTSTTNAPTPTTSIPIGVQYPTGKQYVNPDVQETINASVSSDVADSNAKIMVIGSNGIFNLSTAAIIVGDNTVTFSLRDSSGTPLPNGVWPLRVIAQNKLIAKGKLVTYR